jgi:ABC-2 type transport system permease protein
MSVLTQATADGLVMAKRNLIKVKRIPDLLIFTTVQPIMFVLLFAYVFGGAIPVPGVSYRSYLMAGIFTQTVTFGAGITAIGLADDIQKGIIDRFRSLPMARSAVLFGRTLSDLVNNCIVMVVMSACGLLVGWRIERGATGAIAAYLIIFLFAYSMSWVSATIGLSVRSVEVAQSAGFIWMFPLTFLSNAFVTSQSLPGWLQPVANWNPVSAVVASARELFGNNGTLPRPNAWPMQHPQMTALGWSVLLLVIFIPLSVRKYRAAAAR